MAKISVIVAVHNSERYLDACVASVAAQKLEDIELILVNDASTDGSAAKMEGYAATYPSLTILCLKTDGAGLSDTRNTGLRHATGDFIAFLDDDDTYLPKGLETLLRLFERAPEADIAVGQFESGVSVKTPTVLSPDLAIERTLYQDNGYHNSACAKLYRRSLFDGTLHFEHGRYYEDLELCPRAYAKSRAVVFTGKKVYYYRRRSDSFVNTWSESRADALWAVDAVAALFEDKFPGATRSRRFSAYFNIFNLAVAHKHIGMQLRCWKEIRRLRRLILADPRVRLKNRVAAAISLLGFRTTKVISTIAPTKV